MPSTKQLTRSRNGQFQAKFVADFSKAAPQQYPDCTSCDNGKRVAKRGEKDMCRQCKRLLSNEL